MKKSIAASLAVLCLVTGQALSAENVLPAVPTQVRLIQTPPEAGSNDVRRAETPTGKDGDRLGLTGDFQPELLVQNGFKATWSPGSDRLAFGKEGGGIAILDLHTRRVTELTREGKDPAWSPDGRYIAYVTEPGPGYYLEEVWLVPAAGGEPARMGNGGLPAWSKDSGQVYFHHRGSNQVFAVRVDAPDQAPAVFFAKPRSWYPAITPDDTRLAFGTPGELLVVNRQDDETLARLPMPGRRGALAGWSPDGRQLAFGGFDNDAMGLWIFDFERRGAFPVATNARCTMPAWSPDGRWLAFDHRGDRGKQIWKIATAQLPKSPSLVSQLPTPAARPQPTASVSAPVLELAGKPVPGAFKLPLLNGGELVLPSPHHTNVFLLDFWATWHPPHLPVMPAFAEFSREYADRGVRYVAVNLGEKPEVIRRYLTTAKLDFEVALEPDGHMAKAFQLRVLPMMVLVDRSNVVRKVYFGASPKIGDQLRRELDEVLKK